jgi:CheY-like chemotaxis protein
MSHTKDQKTQIIIAALVIGLAIVRLTFHGFLSGRMDSIFFILLGSGLLLLLIPFQYLKSFKAGGLELSLDQPQVQGAISGMSLDRIKNEKIHEQLSRLKDQLAAIRGSRVLWIDDHPHGVVGERRLLRALGVEVVTAVSSQDAEKTLEADNDFDMIISDVQRGGDSYVETGGVPIHEGVNFIIRLRTSHIDPVIANLPVVFYAAYDWERLIEFTLRARSLYPPPEITNSEEDLIPKVVKILAESRSTPIPGTKEKKPSPIRGKLKYVDAGHKAENDEDSSGGEEEEHFG